MLIEYIFPDSDGMVKIHIDEYDKLLSDNEALKQQVQQLNHQCSELRREIEMNANQDPVF